MKSEENRGWVSCFPTIADLTCSPPSSLFPLLWMWPRTSFTVCTLSSLSLPRTSTFLLLHLPLHLWACQGALCTALLVSLGFPLFLFEDFLQIKVLVIQSCPTLFNSMDWSPPSSSVHGILQARILEWVVMPFSRGSSQPRDRISWSAALTGGFFTTEPPGKPLCSVDIQLKNPWKKEKKASSFVVQYYSLNCRNNQSAKKAGGLNWAKLAI